MANGLDKYDCDHGMQFCLNCLLDLFNDKGQTKRLLSANYNRSYVSYNRKWGVSTGLLPWFARTSLLSLSYRSKHRLHNKFDGSAIWLWIILSSRPYFNLIHYLFGLYAHIFPIFWAYGFLFVLLEILDAICQNRTSFKKWQKSCQ